MIVFFWLIAFLAVPWQTLGAEGQSERLDHSRLKYLYGKGKVDDVLRMMDDFSRARSSSGFSRIDSIVISKYRGVIYSSNPSTRDKGMRNFQKFLEMDPYAEISDLRVNRLVSTVFSALKAKAQSLDDAESFYLVESDQRRPPEKVSAQGNQEGNRTPAKEGVPASSGSWKKWVAWGAAVTGATGALVVYLHYQDEKPPEMTTITLSDE